MSTNNNRYAGEKRQLQSVEESAHWISFNLKKLVEEVKNANVSLERIRLEMQEHREPRSDKTNEAPF